MKLFERRVPGRKKSAATATPPPAELLELDVPASLSDVTNPMPASPSKSLGIGSFGKRGQVKSFTPSPTRKQPQQQSRGSSGSSFTFQNLAEVNKKTVDDTNKPSSSSSNNNNNSKTSLSLLERIEKVSPVVFKRALSSFIRVADLDMAETVRSGDGGGDTLCEETNSEESFPNFHRVSVDPPPGIDADPNELWVCLDNGEGEHAPIAPQAVTALARSGLYSAFDQSMWNPELKTAKLVKTPEHQAWHECTWIRDGPVRPPAGDGFHGGAEREVLVWSGNFTHGRYGSELPAVRSAGLIHMAPKALMDLLVDSDRVKEYNKMSLGRTDLLVLQEQLDGGAFGGITKVMRSETKPPMVRKTLSFTSILHVRRLEGDAGFKLVSRAVTSPVDSSLAGSVLQSEILLSVNIIKRVEGNPNQCLMIALNHIRSPMVPMMIAKRIGLTAAVGFINDLRACCC